MAQQVKRYGALLLALALIAALGVLLTNRPEEATAAPYTNPFWTVTSPAQECPCQGGCGCQGPAEFSAEGVSRRTGELVLDHFLFSMPSSSPCPGRSRTFPSRFAGAR